MKCSIYISGMINGNSTLANAIDAYPYSSRRAAMFNAVYIDFPTKALAYRALWNAYKKLKSEEPGFTRIGIRYCRKSFLKYDASMASIISGTNYRTSLQDGVK